MATSFETNTAAANAENSWAFLQHVYTAVQQVEWPSTKRATQLDAPEPVLRTILTYCYATGTLSSLDIQAACVHDPVVRYICAKHFPSWQTVREFRRGNLSCIIEALAHLFMLLDGSRPLIAARAAAQRCAARAVQADSIALDF